MAKFVFVMSLAAANGKATGYLTLFSVMSKLGTTATDFHATYRCCQMSMIFSKHVLDVT